MAGHSLQNLGPFPPLNWAENPVEHQGARPGLSDTALVAHGTCVSENGEL